MVRCIVKPNTSGSMDGFYWTGRTGLGHKKNRGLLQQGLRALTHGLGALSDDACPVGRWLCLLVFPGNARPVPSNPKTQTANRKSPSNFIKPYTPTPIYAIEINKPQKPELLKVFMVLGLRAASSELWGLCNVRTSDGEGPWVSAFPISSSLQLLQTTGKTNRSFFQATVGACYTTLIGGDDDDDDDDSGGHRPKVCSFSIQPGSLPPGRPSGGGHSYEETCHTSE